MKRAWIKRGTTRLRAQSEKERSVVAPVWRRVKADVRKRSGGRCEVMLTYYQSTVLMLRDAEEWKRFPILGSGLQVVRCANPAQDVHHVIKQSQGGKDVPENLLGVCRACHEWFDAAHSEPRGRLTALPGAAGATPTCAIQRVDKFKAREDACANAPRPC